MSAKVSVYIATSLDGFIARKDGTLDWLDEASTTFIADGASGAQTQSDADEIWAWVQASDNYRQCFLFAFPSHPFDQQWLEGAGITTLTLDPGMGFWYRHKGASGWTWTCPVPY